MRAEQIGGDMRMLFVIALLFSLSYPITSIAQGYTVIQASAMADPGSYGTATCRIPAGYGAKYDLYVWIAPSTWGIVSSVFALDYPANVQPVDTFSVNGAIVAFSVGNLVDGIEVVTDGCVTDWNWIVRQSFWVTTSDETRIDFLPTSNPLYYMDMVYFHRCDGDHFEFNETRPLQLNLDPEYFPCTNPIEMVVGIESSSWGAIKAIYRKL